MRTLLTLAASLAALCAPCSDAQVLYKLTDSRGKVTYVDTVPKDFDGKVQRMDMNGATNAMAPQKAVPTPARPQSEWEAIIRKQPAKPSGRETRLRAAQEKVEQAESTLQGVLDTLDHAENWIYTGGGGLQNRFLKPEVEARVEGLRQNVAIARDELRTVERELY